MGYESIAHEAEGKDHLNKIEVPDPLAVEDLISSKLNSKRKLARLITQYSPGGREEQLF